MIVVIGVFYIRLYLLRAHLNSGPLWHVWEKEIAVHLRFGVGFVHGDGTETALAQSDQADVLRRGCFGGLAAITVVVAAAAIAAALCARRRRYC